jgi:serine phosphatase RsbU (regulator of sigma subunit)
LLTFSVQAVPFMAIALALVALALLAALRRGDLVVRLGLVMTTVTALPWAMTMVLVGSTTDHELARRLCQAGYAPIPLIGSGLLMVILAVVGRLDAQRPVLVTSIVLGLTMMVLTATTDLVIDGVRMTPWGILFPSAGPLYGFHIALFVGIVGWGVWLSHRSGSVGWLRAGVPRGRLAASLAVVSLLTISDSLLAYDIIGVYPFACVPALAACGLTLYAIDRQDLLRGRGLDGAVAVELAVLAIAATSLVGIAIAVEGSRTTIMLGVAAVSAGAMVIVGRSAVRDDVVTGATPAVERFVDRIVASGDAYDVGRGLAELLEGQRLARAVRVWVVLDGRWVPAHIPPGASADLDLPEDVRAWLTETRRTIATVDITTARLGTRRAAIEDWATRMAADVIVPLIDGDELIGLVAGQRDEALRDSERVAMDEAVIATSRAVTVIGLTHEIEARAELAREMELAEAVRQARSAADVRELAGFRVTVSYQPASRVAGDLWSCVSLPDERLLVLVGDVAGRGLASALVSAAVLGAGQVAAGLLGSQATPEAVLALLHDTVVEVDGGRHRVTAFAAIVDRRAHRITYASAGHRGGYLVRRRDADAELVALIGRGTALGERERVIGTGDRELGPDDMIVLISDGVIEARNPSGQAWGERRLQRALRDLASRAGDHLGDALLDGARGHAGEATHDDDLLVVVVGPAEVARA